jgi:polyphenol oxidase
MTLPDVPDSFHWTTEPWGAALRCGPLEAIAHHLFSSRQLALRAPGGWASLGQSLGVDENHVRRVTQVHGNLVVTVEAGDTPAGQPEADAQISADPSIVLAVVAADCVPLLIADARTGAVAAVHAGWRGTAAKIAVTAVEAMQREFGTQPEHLTAAIGPAIGPCCYEVGSELVDAFATAGHARHLIDRWFVALPPRRGEPRSSRPRLRLDVPGANRDQLILAGMSEDRIHIAGVCSAMHLDIVTSYRVEKEQAVRIAGAIRARG